MVFSKLPKLNDKNWTSFDIRKIDPKTEFYIIELIDKKNSF